MNTKEKELVTEEFISTEQNYNMGVGGEGGPHFKNKKHNEETKRKISQNHKGGKKGSTPWNKGGTSWNKGKKWVSVGVWEKCQPGGKVVARVSYALKAWFDFRG